MCTCVSVCTCVIPIVTYKYMTRLQLWGCIFWGGIFPLNSSRHCSGFHTGFLAWGGGIYWCINEARKCEGVIGHPSPRAPRKNFEDLASLVKLDPMHMQLLTLYIIIKFSQILGGGGETEPWGGKSQFPTPLYETLLLVLSTSIYSTFTY